MKNKIIILLIIIVSIIAIIFGASFIVLNQKLKNNDTYYKTEFEVNYISETYRIKIPQEIAYNGTSGNVVYSFKTLKSRNKLKREIENLYSNEYKDMNKYDNEGYKLYYDEKQDITIGYQIDNSGLTDLYLVVYEELN